MLTNQDISTCFRTKKSLRQVDPLSPTLFDIALDILAIIVARAKEDGKVKGPVPHLIEDGWSILQHANDTVVFMDHGIEQDKNMTLLSFLTIIWS